ncbi:MAG: FecR family protein [Treponema sp.]|nr:FecR family protein [Treponema sp.]
MRRACLTVLFLLMGFYAYSQGIIREISGTVEVKHAGAASFVTANVGDRLREDTIISTSFRSFAVVEIGHSTMTVRPLTRLSLTEIRTSNQEETLNVNLQSGRVRVDVKPPAGTKANMSVQSPSAVASVRGTSFEFDTRHVFVSDGSVSLAGTRGQEVTINAGSEGRIDINSKAVNTAIEKQAPRVAPLPITAGMTTGIFRGPARTSVPFVIGLEFN